jgi:hypothetical protein
MDIDNITDIELLRKLAKANRARVKKDSYATDGTDFVFKEGLWYITEQDQYGITVYSEDMESMMFLNYDEAGRFLYECEMEV